VVNKSIRQSKPMSIVANTRDDTVYSMQINIYERLNFNPVSGQRLGIVISGEASFMSNFMIVCQQTSRNKKGHLLLIAPL
jgi:hypothetical protein